MFAMTMIHWGWGCCKSCRMTALVSPSWRWAHIRPARGVAQAEFIGTLGALTIKTINNWAIGRMENLLVNGWTGFWEHVFFNTVFQPWFFTMKYRGILQIFPSFLSPPARAASTFLAYRGKADWLERDGSTLRASSHLNCYKYHFWWENHHFWWENSL